MAKRPKRPRDPNQLAKMVVEIATGDRPNDQPTEPSKRRIGGLKGGAARAATLTAEARKAIAKKAAQARWRRQPQSE